MVGQTLAHYKILEKLGAGGMGEVYRAEDTRLGREVAIKVLREELASQPERLKRFEREARAASALDHPNIVTIHDIAEADGQHFIVMQYVAGRTLGDLMTRGRLELNKTLHYAIQIADGLTRSHQHGITHRDLKPDNIIVTDDGQVKILDFGLAKLTEPAIGSELSTLDIEHPLTQEGRIVGTAPYMSPEQTQGHPVDALSDIFSLGSVLYEMVTGRRAFSGSSTVAVLSAVAHEEPESVSALVPTVPLALERVIHRALRKQPERRFQSVADMRIELLETQEQLATGDVLLAEQVVRDDRARHTARWWWAMAAVVLALIIGSAGWYYIETSKPSGPPPRTVPLTSYPGYETDLALSPDGKQVAFIWDGGNEGVRHLYVKLVDGGEPLQRTEGSVQHSSPTWSPDGTRVVFLRHLEADTNEILEITALGGEPRRLGTTTVNSSFHGFVGSHGLSFSPDGKLLAIVDRDSADEPDAIFLLSTETGKKRRVTSPPPDRNPWGDSRPAFSPDGRTLAFLRQWENEDVEIYVQPLGAEEATRVAAADLFAWDVEWTPDGKTLVFSTGPTFANSYLVKVPVTGGPPSQLLIGKRARYLSIARGGRLAYSEWLQDVNTWRVGGPKSAEPSSPTQFLASTRDDMMPAYSPDGTKLAFISDRAGTWEVWISNADGTNPRQLTHLGHAIWPRWSPTGRTIAFNSMQGARSHVYVVDASGGFPEVLTEGFMADWSADERWIYFSSLNGRDAQIWKIPARGGQPTQLTKNGGMGPQKGPDGQVFYSRDGRVWSVSAEGGESAAVVDQTVNWDQWCVWRSNLVFLSPKGEKGPSIAVFNLTTRETTELVALGPEMKPSFGLNVSPDGRSILYTRKDRSGSDLMLVENFH